VYGEKLDYADFRFLGRDWSAALCRFNVLLIMDYEH